MSGKISTAVLLFTVAMLLSSLSYVHANPAIVPSLNGNGELKSTGYDPLEICIENCALCKKMFGAWFEGPLCAESCIKFKGKLIPECEDFGSISPFLNKL